MVLGKHLVEQLVVRAQQQHQVVRAPQHGLFSMFTALVARTAGQLCRQLRQHLGTSGTAAPVLSTWSLDSSMFTQLPAHVTIQSAS